MLKSPFSRVPLILICAVFAMIWFAQLNLRHLIPSDEGRYAEIAREMLVTGDWVTPRYNGYFYFDKPPLQLWINTATFAAFGVGEWQARFYTALSGFLAVLLIAFTGMRVFNANAGFFAALALASSPYWNLLGHFNTLDMGLSFWMTVTLCAFLLAQRPHLPPTVVRSWMWICWASMALAVLSKGLIGAVLPSTVLVLYMLVARDWALWRRLYLASGMLIFAAIVLPWFILIQTRHPSFFDYFFIVQHFRRYLTPEQQRSGPLYYFLPVIFIGFLPWISVLVQSISHGLKWPRQSNGFSPAWLLIVWCAFIFIFFSLSHSKLISYALPIAPAIALLISLYLPLLTHAQWQRHLMSYLALIAIACIGAIFLLHAGDARTPNALYRTYWVWVMVALTVAFAGTIIALWFNARAKTMALTLIIHACGWFAATTIAGNAHEIFGHESSGIQLVPAVKSAMVKMPTDTPFYSVGMLDHTLPFYFNHTMILVEHLDELAFGVQQAPKQWVPTIETWIRRWKNDPYALALMPPSLYATLSQQGVPMQVIARDQRRVIAAKPFYIRHLGAAEPKQREVTPAPVR